MIKTSSKQGLSQNVITSPASSSYQVGKGNMDG